MWQLAGRGDQSLTALLRAIVIRMARALGGGVDYWLGLPIDELLLYMNELADQLRTEREQT